MTALRVDVVVVQNLPWRTWIARVLEVEALGYDGVWVWDHLVHRTQEPTDPLHEGFTTLAAAAALTTRIRLGTLVASPVLRSPLLLAKSAMTVDQMSDGRFDLGIGAGGSLLDSAALGIAQPTAGELAERFEQTVELVDVVLRGGTSYAGSLVSGEGMTIAPGCVQRPRVPRTGRALCAWPAASPMCGTPSPRRTCRPTRSSRWPRRGCGCSTRRRSRRVATPPRSAARC